MAAHCVNWFEEYSLVYRTGCKTHTVDAEELVARYAGLEEAAYFEMVARLGLSGMPRRPRPRNLAFPHEAHSYKMRLIRLYAQHVPNNLTRHKINEWLEHIKKDGPQAIFQKLTNRYCQGVEPSTLKDVKTRIRVYLCAYDLWDRLPQIDAWIRLYGGDEEAYLRRLVSEYGAEPQEPDSAESYDYRSRVRRFLTLHEPLALPRLETILGRFEGRELELMAMLQRRYGREPTEGLLQEQLGKKDAAYQKKQQEQREARERAAKQRAEKQRQQEEMREKKMQQIGVFSWDTGGQIDLIELPGGAKRPELMVNLRQTLVEGRRLPEAKVLEYVHGIFSYYNRPLVAYSEEIVKKRLVSDVDERMEFLAFLEQLFTNVLPLSATESLRTVLSLLEMKIGKDAIDEIKQAGSVNGFLSQVDAQSEREWVGYMTSIYGGATEYELALKNRIRFFLMKAKGITDSEAVEELDRYIARCKESDKTSRNRPASQKTKEEMAAEAEAEQNPQRVDERRLEEFLDRLQVQHGREPKFPVLVSKQRVLRLLDRNAPGKLDKIDYVIQAHSIPGDTSALSMDRILRTYGSEQTSFDAVMAKFEAEELNSRFQVWSQQTRLRNIFSRRLKALENPDMDVLQSVIERTAKYNQEHNKQQNQAQAAKEAAQAQAAALAAAAASEDGFEAKTPEELLEHQERQGRNQLNQTWRQDLLAIAENAPHVATRLDRHIEVEELFSRIAAYDDAVAKYSAFSAQMKEEEEELSEWLKARLVWRDQWKIDEAANLEKQKREADKQRILEEEAIEERRRKDSEAAAEASAHFQAMQDLQESLHTQATKVLQYQAKIKSLRTRGHLGLSRNSIDVETHRHIHSNCVFNKNVAYNANVKPLEITVVDDKFDYIRPDESADANVDPNQVDKGSWEYVFKRQCRSYVEQLLKAYDPARLPRLDDIMRRYNNREHDLIAALEQQCDIEHNRTSDLVDRVKEYYERMAPDRMEEMDTVLRRFNYQAELIWPFLYTQYGAHPRRRGPELREYLRQRLGCYLARVAPKLLPEVDRLIDQCPMLGCESLFRELTSKFGPEDQQFEIEATTRSLIKFYRRRKLPYDMQTCSAIAKRFAGRTKLLNEILGRMFNDNLEKITEDD